MDIIQTTQRRWRSRREHTTPLHSFICKDRKPIRCSFSRAVLQDRTDDGRKTAAHAFTDDREQDRARHQYGAHHQYIVTCCAISKSSASSPRRVSLRRKKITKKSRRPPTR